MSNTLVVADKYRKNYLSTIAGGSTVTLIESSGFKKAYTNVKNVSTYVKQLLRNNTNIVEVLVDGESVWKIKNPK